MSLLPNDYRVEEWDRHCAAQVAAIASLDHIDIEGLRFHLNAGEPTGEIEVLCWEQAECDVLSGEMTWEDRFCWYGAMLAWGKAPERGDSLPYHISKLIRNWWGETIADAVANAEVPA